MTTDTLPFESPSTTLPDERARALAAFALIGWPFTLLLKESGINLTIVMVVLFAYSFYSTYFVPLVS